MLNVDELPYLTGQIPGLGGLYKSRRSDFVVREEPLYPASGEGTHIYFELEKEGLPTLRAVQEIARALGRKSQDIGYAGLKDAEAVTSQWMSLEHIDPQRLEKVSMPHMRVRQVTRHTNKLKLGHLKGNRFEIKLRQADPARLEEARATLAVLVTRGVPNYFGHQRFGMRGDTWEIGRAILRNDLDEALAIMLGRPGPRDHGDILIARQLFDQGQYLEAAEAWPPVFRNERRICQAMARSDGNARRAFGAADKQLKRLYLSAYQSILFNQVAAQRIHSLDQLLPGDLAWRHPQGAVFKVEDLEKEQLRCDAFEISPTGPLYGHRMSEPAGEPGRMEKLLLEVENIDLTQWREQGRHRVAGARRPLRFQPHEAMIEAGHDEHGDYIEVRFFLESGCYATSVLREICKGNDQ